MSTSLNFEKGYEGTVSKKTIDKGDIERQLMKIEELDASIYSLKLEMEEVSNELFDLQVKYRETLKQMLQSNPPECEALAKNTQLFFNLHSNDCTDDEEQLCNSQILHSTIDVDVCEKFEMSDEKKQELRDLLKSSLIHSELTKDYLTVDNKNMVSELNSCSIDEESHTELTITS